MCTATIRSIVGGNEGKSLFYVGATILDHLPIKPKDGYLSIILPGGAEDFVSPSFLPLVMCLVSVSLFSCFNSDFVTGPSLLHCNFFKFKLCFNNMSSVNG